MGCVPGQVGARKVRWDQLTGVTGEQGPQECQAPIPVGAQDRAVVASSAGGRAGRAFLGWRGAGLAVSEWPLPSGGWPGPSAPTGGSHWWTWVAHAAWPFRVLSGLELHRPIGSVCKRTVEQMGLRGAQPRLGPAAQRGSLRLAASAGNPVTPPSPHVWVQEQRDRAVTSASQGLLVTPSSRQWAGGCGQLKPDARWRPGLVFQEPGPAC